jgi:UDP:flavonoid glycosyltransferase YjiC (YdhE family)
MFGVLGTPSHYSATYKLAQEHIFLYQTVPQLDIFSKCDLMVNQGGMQSVQERVLKTVPILVSSLNPDLDQEANVALFLPFGSR